MSIFNVNLDLSSLGAFGHGFQKQVEGQVRQAVGDLTAATHAHIVEEAGKKLHTRRAMFIEALSWHADQDGKFFVIQLDASARWIDDGMEPHNMIDDLLKSDKAKTAADGSKYMSVPFEHGGGPTQNTPSQMNLLDNIKQVLKDKQIPYKKVELGACGQPKLGLLHAFSILDRPIKGSEGPGTGQGPIGAVMQGWSEDGKSGTPLLAGVRIYQKKGKGKKGEDIIQRAIMTFRTVSSKHAADSGRWDHPGLEAIGLLDEGATWAMEEWEKRMGPAVLGRLTATIS